MREASARDIRFPDLPQTTTPGKAGEQGPRAERREAPGQNSQRHKLLPERNKTQSNLNNKKESQTQRVEEENVVQLRDVQANSLTLTWSL